MHVNAERNKLKERATLLDTNEERRWKENEATYEASPRLHTKGDWTQFPLDFGISDLFAYEVFAASSLLNRKEGSLTSAADGPVDRENILTVNPISPCVLL